MYRVYILLTRSYLRIAHHFDAHILFGMHNTMKIVFAALPARVIHELIPGTRTMNLALLSFWSALHARTVPGYSNRTGTGTPLYPVVFKLPGTGYTKCTRYQVRVPGTLTWTLCVASNIVTLALL